MHSSVVSHFWTLILGTIISLLPIINPIAVSSTFLAITEGDSPERRLEQLKRACLFMILILVVSLLFGTFIMNVFGISIPGLRIAGGMLVVGIGWDMLNGKHVSAKSNEVANNAARAKLDISFSPLAMPLLSGPGSIAVTIGFTSLATGYIDYVAIILGIGAVSIITYIILRLSSHVVKVIGTNGMTALTKIMGFLLVCVGIQFFVNGLVGIATEPALIQSIKSALK
jgi:multiple antibiotic resistance protein